MHASGAHDDGYLAKGGIGDNVEASQWGIGRHLDTFQDIGVTGSYATPSNKADSNFPCSFSIEVDKRDGDMACARHRLAQPVVLETLDAVARSITIMG